MLKSTIIRVLAFAALFAYVVPAGFALVGFGSSFAFTGGVITALAVGAAYMAAMFVVLAAIGIAASPFKLTDDKKNKLAPLWGTIFFVATMLCLLGAGKLAPWLGLTVTGLLPSMIGSALAIAVMSFTKPKLST